MKRKTATLTLSAALVALGVVLLLLGGVLEVLELTAVALASVLVFFAHRELPFPSAWLIFAATATLSLLLVPNRTAALLYLIFGGWYPIVRHYIECLPRPLAWVLKLVAFNAAATAVLVGSYLLFGLPPEGALIYALVYALGNLAFVFYDIVLGRSVFFYTLRLRPLLDRLFRK